jgi:hypothetical protein
MPGSLCTLWGYLDYILNREASARNLNISTGDDSAQKVLINDLQNPENGCDRLLRNVCNRLQDYMASQPIRKELGDKPFPLSLCPSHYRLGSEPDP